MRTVGNNIRKYREKAGISQEALAEKLNVTRQAVSNWELSKTEPDIDPLHRIADSLGVMIEELIYGYKQQTTIIHNHNTTQKIEEASTQGIGFGCALAMVISYVKWQSIGWAILHGAMSWGYVIYYFFKYVKT